MIKDYFKLFEYSARALLLFHATGRLVTLLFAGWHMQAGEVMAYLAVAAIAVLVGAVPYSFVDREYLKSIYFSAAGIGFLSSLFVFIETVLFGQLQFSNYLFALIQVLAAISFLMLAYGLWLWFEPEAIE